MYKDYYKQDTKQGGLELMYVIVVGFHMLWA